jgi:hypothetical protein
LWPVLAEILWRVGSKQEDTGNKIAGGTKDNRNKIAGGTRHNRNKIGGGTGECMG